MSATVTIPAPRLRDAGSFVTVDLPLIADISRPAHLGTAIGAFCLGLLIVSPGLLAVVVLLAMPAFGSAWLILPLSLLCLALGGSFIAMAVTALRDLGVKNPALIVSDEGIWDRRVSDRVLRWDEISRATSLVASNGGILLALCLPLRTHFSRFRAGTFGLVWNKPPEQAYISIRFLSVRPQTIESVILTLARDNGAKVTARNGFGMDAPLHVGPPSRG